MCSLNLVFSILVWIVVVWVILGILCLWFLCWIYDLAGFGGNWVVVPVGRVLLCLVCGVGFAVLVVWFRWLVFELVLWVFYWLVVWGWWSMCALAWVCAFAGVWLPWFGRVWVWVSGFGKRLWVLIRYCCCWRCLFCFILFLLFALFLLLLLVVTCYFTWILMIVCYDFDFGCVFGLFCLIWLYVMDYFLGWFWVFNV